MKYRTLDNTGDSTFGSLIFLHEKEAVAQAILTRLKLLHGEWWEETSDGLPLFESILGVYGGEEARNAIDLIISERIQGTKNVTEVVTYESSFNSKTRQYSANCTVNTTFGELVFSISNNLAILEVIY